MKLARAISSSSFSCIFDHFHHYKDLFFLSVNLILIGSFSFHRFPPSYYYYIWLKFWQLKGQLPKILWNIRDIVCFYCITAGSDNSNVTSITQINIWIILNIITKFLKIWLTQNFYSQFYKIVNLVKIKITFV